uniref:Uncharacterized protein n=1 Tax=Iridovirus sp. TaxID=135728 RepID=A0AAU7YC61_9VIRU
MYTKPTLLRVLTPFNCFTRSASSCKISSKIQKDFSSDFQNGEACLYFFKTEVNCGSNLNVSK